MFINLIVLDDLDSAAMLTLPTPQLGGLMRALAEQGGYGGYGGYGGGCGGGFDGDGQGPH